MRVAIRTAHLWTSTFIFVQLCASNSILSTAQPHLPSGGGDRDKGLKLKRVLPTSEQIATKTTDVCGERDAKMGKCSLPASSSSSSSSSSAVHTKGEKPCGVYLALSTLPGTGIGMFAGRDYQKLDPLMEVGDHIIPILDMSLHQKRGEFFLWDSYTWDPTVVRAENEGLKSTNVASPGFGVSPIV